MAETLLRDRSHLGEARVTVELMNVFNGLFLLLEVVHSMLDIGILATFSSAEEPVLLSRASAISQIVNSVDRDLPCFPKKFV